jgi:hypothetical protein
MTPETPNLDLVLAVAFFAIAHLHAIVWRTAQSRNGVSPNVATVTADAVDFVKLHLIRLAVGRMAFSAREPGSLHVDRV